MNVLKSCRIRVKSIDAFPGFQRIIKGVECVMNAQKKLSEHSTTNNSKPSNSTI